MGAIFRVHGSKIGVTSVSGFGRGWRGYKSPWEVKDIKVQTLARFEILQGPDDVLANGRAAQHAVVEQVDEDHGCARSGAGAVGILAGT